MTAQDCQQEHVAGCMCVGGWIVLLDDCSVGVFGNHGRGCEDIDGSVRSVVCDAAIVGRALGQQEIRLHVHGLVDWPEKNDTVRIFVVNSCIRINSCIF